MSAWIHVFVGTVFHVGTVFAASDLLLCVPNTVCTAVHYCVVVYCLVRGCMMLFMAA